jgi:hypothetical protein
VITYLCCFLYYPSILIGKLAGKNGVLGVPVLEASVGEFLFPALASDETMMKEDKPLQRCSQ